MESVHNSRGGRTLLLSMVFALVLAAVTLPAAAKETLTLYVPGSGISIYGAYAEMAQTVAKEMGYEISIVTAGTWAEYFQKIAVHQAGNLPVDIILQDDYNAAMWFASGMFMDLTPFVKSDKVDMNQFFPVATEIKRYKNQLVGIPCNVGISTLFYNKDLLQAAGVNDLPHDWQAPGWDWASFINIMKKATRDIDGDGLMDQVGLARWGHGIDPWLWGADFTNASASRSTLDDPRVTTAYEETLKLYTEHSAAVGPLARVAKNVPVKSSFYTAKALALQGLDADAAGYAKAVKEQGNGSAIDVTVFPKVAERHTSFLSWGWGIGAGSKNAEAAWKIIKAITYDRNFLAKNAAKTGRLPALRSAAPQVMGYLMETAPVDWGVFVGALTDPNVAKISRWFFNKNANDANTLISKMQTDITSGKRSVVEAVQQTHAQLDNLLKAGAW